MHPGVVERQKSAFFGIKRQLSGGRRRSGTGGIERHSEIRKRLISLVDKGKAAPLVTDSIYRVVAMEFEAISEARNNRVSWNEIANACGFPGKENLFCDAFSKERRPRAKKEKEVMPEQKTEKRIGEEKSPTPEPGIQPNPLSKGTSSPKLQNPGSRDSGERTSIPQ